MTRGDIIRARREIERRRKIEEVVRICGGVICIFAMMAFMVFAPALVEALF